MGDDIFDPDVKIAINTHVIRDVVIDTIDGVPYWHSLTRRPDGTYEESFEWIDMGDD
jgi:hypothetical protein